MIVGTPHVVVWICVMALPGIAVVESTTAYQPRDHYLINCGATGDIGEWSSDKDATFAPLLTTTTSISYTTGDPNPPYDSCRLFSAPVTYSFPLSSQGPYFVRLYFSATTTLNSIDPSLFFVSVTANEFTLLRNFSAYSAAVNAQSNPNTNPPVPQPQGQLVREFYVTVRNPNKPLLNLTFSPEPSKLNTTTSYGFINGIEVISVPYGLYVPNNTATPFISIPYLLGGVNDFAKLDFTFPESVAMETVIRLNVGGSDVAASADDTGLNRTWYKDDNYRGDFMGTTLYNYTIKVVNNSKLTAAYTAPEVVYDTARIMGAKYSIKEKLSSNLTWMLEVDAGFKYLVRLHFCEIFYYVNQSQQLQFSIYINSQMGLPALDAFDWPGPGVPMYRDFVTTLDDNAVDLGITSNSSGTRVHLPISLHPIAKSVYVDAFLNGLEIFKLNKTDGSLAAANPRLPVTDPTTDKITPRKPHHLVPIIIGGTLGVTLLFLVASAFYFICRGKDKEETSSLIQSSSKPTTPKWAALPMDESQSSTATSTATISNSSVASSLPSNLCQRFTLNQVRIATSDFDDSAVIGSGGFGKVYKGSIENGATLVAIKRLNPSSNQGANEFRNEIEMLSRLRHLHLVSLIGYCEDHGEMILVYEYMPQGTLRDHLLYKTDARNNTPLSWKQRLMICIGSARGLHYLHSGAKHPIIHRDVKSTNILLDDKWTAKVSDFGLSKVGPTTGAGHVSTAVKGSIGYLDPEYYRFRRLTEKSDVYSFGVVLFEVLCGRQAMNPQLPKDEVNLALWARSHYIGGTLETIVDPNLGGQIAPECLRKFGEVAEMCVRDHGNDRPSMSDIVWALEFALQLQQTADQKITGSPNGDDHDVTTKTHQVLVCSEDNLCESSLSIGGSGTVESFHTPNKAASSSDSEVVGLTTSASVFSEIMHPQPR